MFENIMNFFKKLTKKEQEKSKVKNKESSDTAKERLHLVLMQDRANVSADFLELMRQEIIEVIKKYIDVDEQAIDVHLTNKANEDGTIGAPALYANIPIITIKNEARKVNVQNANKNENIKEEKNEVKNEKKDEANKEVEKNTLEENKVEKEKTNEENNKQEIENQNSVNEQAETTKNNVEEDNTETAKQEVVENAEEKENKEETASNL